MKRLVIILLFTITLGAGCEDSASNPPATGGGSEQHDACHQEFTGNDEQDAELLQNCLDEQYSDDQ